MRFEAGAVKVEVELARGFSLRMNGTTTTASSIDVLTTTKFEIGEAGSLTIRPPKGSGRSLDAGLAAATEELASALRSRGIDSYSAGVARNERASAAERELTSLRAQIAAGCPGDPTIGLAPGADALRAFIATLDQNAGKAVAPSDDITALEKAVAEAKLAEAGALGKHENSRAVLSKAESTLTTAEAELAAALRESEAAAEDLQRVAASGDRTTLAALNSDAQRERTAKFEAVEAARERARALDIDAIRRGITNLDRAATRAGEERIELTAKIASLEATILKEGTAGPAGRLAAARDEEHAASEASERLRREADTLEMLRRVLSEAAEEACRTFLAPVTKRAARYVHQLLPGCDLSFDEELGLAGVTRLGVDEPCSGLSRGTQEQLAILTRLAFADLLLEDGAPISLILDDPLVYSDDARLETMTDILQEASTRMQVILLTCRTKAFRHLEANRIMLK